MAFRALSFSFVVYGLVLLVKVCFVFIVLDLEVLVLFRTKIPDPPIHFSGPTNFFRPNIDFTNHQFETSVPDPPMFLYLSRTTNQW